MSEHENPQPEFTEDFGDPMSQEELDAALAMGDAENGEDSAEETPLKPFEELDPLHAMLINTAKTELSQYLEAQKEHDALVTARDEQGKALDEKIKATEEYSQYDAMIAAAEKFLSELTEKISANANLDVPSEESIKTKSMMADLYKQKYEATAKLARGNLDTFDEYMPAEAAALPKMRARLTTESVDGRSTKPRVKAVYVDTTGTGNSFELVTMKNKDGADISNFTAVGNKFGVKVPELQNSWYDTAKTDNWKEIKSVIEFSITNPENSKPMMVQVHPQ